MRRKPATRRKAASARARPRGIAAPGIGAGPDERGYFGEFGGRFVPETLMPAVTAVEQAFARYRHDPSFLQDLAWYNENFGGRPTPLYHARRVSAAMGARIWLKREDLVHGGAHKFNNVMGQALLAARMGRTRLIAETGAGQHGVATAMAGAALGLPVEVYMGAKDVERQSLNVFRMRLMGAKVHPVASGNGTLKDAVNEALRDWSGRPDDTYYCIGSVVGPHPFPLMVREFQRVIGTEIRSQFPIGVRHASSGGARDAGLGGKAARLGKTQPGTRGPTAGMEGGAAGMRGRAAGRPRGKQSGGQGEPKAARPATLLPDAIVACVGGGSNAIGSFHPFLKDPVRLVGVEAAGHGIASGMHAATLNAGTRGILHGALSMLLQDDDGQVTEPHSISAGLDYPGVGPEHAHLQAAGRVHYTSATDAEALEATKTLCRLEGILPALESAHALAGAMRLASEMPGQDIVITLSGRGDKDIHTLLRELEGAV